MRRFSLLISVVLALGLVTMAVPVGVASAHSNPRGVSCRSFGRVTSFELPAPKGALVSTRPESGPPRPERLPGIRHTAYCVPRFLLSTSSRASTTKPTATRAKTYGKSHCARRTGTTGRPSGPSGKTRRVRCKIAWAGPATSQAWEVSGIRTGMPRQTGSTSG